MWPIHLSSSASAATILGILGIHVGLYLFIDLLSKNLPNILLKLVVLSVPTTPCISEFQKFTTLYVKMSSDLALLSLL